MTRKHPHPAVSVNRRRAQAQKPVKEEPKVVIQAPPPAIIPVEPPTEKPLPVTMICVNYKTEWLTRDAIRTFRQFYPTMKIVLVDNNSKDKSTQLIKRLGQHDLITPMLINHNIGHGPAMNRAIRQHVKTPYAFLLDSDTITKKGGFIEAMLAKLQEAPLNYAIGWLRRVNQDGVAYGVVGKSGIPYVHPFAALIKLELYYKLPPFEYHGAPCLSNMRKARTLGYNVFSFPIFQYVRHIVAGTRRMWNGQWDIKDKPKQKAWNAKDDIPI